MASPSAKYGKEHLYSALHQPEFDHDHDQDQAGETRRLTIDDYSDEIYKNVNAENEKGEVEPRNEKGHQNYKFSPLPQSESDHDHNENELDNQPTSIFVESIRPTTVDDDYSEELMSDNMNRGTSETIQDLLGLTVLLMLIFSPLYRRMGSPTEDPAPPLYILNSMYVSNFTTANGKLEATWDAKLTVTNANVSSIYFRCVDFTIFYKHNPEDALSVASLYPFYLDQGEDVKLHLKFKTSTGWEDDQPCVEDWLVEEIGKDRAKDGALSFGMQIKVDAVYYGRSWVSDVEMSPHSEDLMVQFLPNKGSGRLTNPNRNFSVPIGWKPFSLF